MVPTASGLAAYVGTATSPKQIRMTGVMATMSRDFPLWRDNLATLDRMSGSVASGACAPSARKDSLPRAGNSWYGGVRQGVSTRSSNRQQEAQVAIDLSGVPIFNPFTKLPPRIFVRPKEKQECCTVSEAKNLVSQCQSVIRSAFSIGFTHRTHLSPMHGGCTACPSAGSEECAPSGVLAPVAGVRAAAHVPSDAAPGNCRRALLRGTSSVRKSSPIKICDEQGCLWAPNCSRTSPLKQLHNFPLIRFLLCGSSNEGSSSLEKESYSVGEEIPFKQTRSARGCSLGLVARTAARPVCASAHSNVTGGRSNDDSVPRRLRHWTTNRFTQQVLLFASICTLFCSTPHVLPRDLAVTRTDRTRSGRSEAVVFAWAQPAGFHYLDVEEPPRPQFEQLHPYYAEETHEPHGALRASDHDGGLYVSSSFPQQVFKAPISHVTSPPQQQAYSPQTTAAQQYADQFLSSIREHYLGNLANSYNLGPVAAEAQQHHLSPEEQLEYAARFHLAQQQQHRTNPVDSFAVDGNAAPQQNRAYNPKYLNIDDPFVHHTPQVPSSEQPRTEQQSHVPQPHYLGQKQNTPSGFHHSALQLQYPAEERFTQVQQQSTGYFRDTPQPHQSVDFLGATPGTNYASPQPRVHFQPQLDFESAEQQNSSDLQYTEYVDRNFGGAVQQAYLPVDHSRLSHQYSQLGGPERGPQNSYVQHTPIEQLPISEIPGTPEPQQYNEYVYVPHQRYIPGVLEPSEVSDYGPEPSPTYFQDYAPSSDQIDFSLQQSLQQYNRVDRHIAPVQVYGSQVLVAAEQQRDVKYDYIPPHYTDEASLLEQRRSLHQLGSAPVQQQFPRQINVDFGGNPVQRQFPRQINQNFEGNPVQQQYTPDVEELTIEGNPYHEPFSTEQFNTEETSYRRLQHQPDVPRVTERQQLQHEGTRQSQRTTQRPIPPHLRAGLPNELPTGKDAELQTVDEPITYENSYSSKPAQQTLRPQSEFQARGYRPTEELHDLPGESQRKSTAHRRLTQSQRQQSTAGVPPSADSEKGRNSGRGPLHEDEPQLATPEDRELYSQTQEANKAEAGPQTQVGTAEQDLTAQQPEVLQRVTSTQAPDHFVNAEVPPQNEEGDQGSQQQENKQHQQPRTITPKDLEVAGSLEESVKELEQLLDKAPFREEVTPEEQTEDDAELEAEQESEEVEADNSTSAELQGIEAKPEGGEQQQVEPEQKGEEVEAHDTTSAEPQEIEATPESGKSQQFESEQEGKEVEAYDTTSAEPQGIVAKPKDGEQQDVEPQQGEEVETHQSTSAGLHEINAKPEGEKQQQFEAGSTDVQLLLPDDDPYQESGDDNSTSFGTHALDVPQTTIDGISKQDGQLQRAASEEQLEQETATPLDDSLLSSPGANHPAQSPPERTGGAVARRLTAAPEQFDYYAALNQQERKHDLEPSRLPLKRQYGFAGEPENLEDYGRKSDQDHKESARKDTQGLNDIQRGNRKYEEVDQNEAEDDDWTYEDTDSETQSIEEDAEEQDTKPPAHVEIHPLIGKRDYKDASRETSSELDDDESEATETADENVDNEEEDGRSSSKPLQEIPGHLSTLSEDKGGLKKEETSKAATLTGQGTEAEVEGVKVVSDNPHTLREGLDTLEKKAADTVTLIEPILSKANGDAQAVGSITGDDPRGKQQVAASEKARPQTESALHEEGEKSAVITRKVKATSEAPTQQGDLTRNEDVRETDPLVEDQIKNTGDVATLEDSPVTDLKGFHGEDGQGNQNSEEKKQEKLTYSAPLEVSVLVDRSSPEQEVHETDKQHEEGKHLLTDTAQPEDDTPENKPTGEEVIGRKGQDTEKPEHPQAEYDAEQLGVSSQESEEKPGVDLGPEPSEQQRPAQNQDGELGREQPQDFQPFELQTAAAVSQEASRGSVQSDAATASGGHTTPQNKTQHQGEGGKDEKVYPLKIAEGRSSDNVHLADKEHQKEEERVTSEEGLKAKSQATEGAQQASLAVTEEEQADRIHGNDEVVVQSTSVQDDKELAAEGPEYGKPAEKGEPVESVDTVRNTEDIAQEQSVNTLSGVREPQAEKQELAAKEREEASALTGNVDAAKEAALEQVQTPAELEGKRGEGATVQEINRSDEGEISPTGGVEAALDQYQRQPNSRRGVQAIEGAQEEAEEGDKEVKEAVADAQAQLDGDASKGPVTEEAKKGEEERTRAFLETSPETHTDIGAQNNSEKASVLSQETVGRVEELNEPRSGEEPAAKSLKSPPENAKAEETGGNFSPEASQNADARQFLPEEKRSFDPFFVGHGKADTTSLIHNKEVTEIPPFDSLPSHTAGETTSPGAVLPRRNSPLSWALKEAHISTDKEGRARKTERKSVNEEGSESDDRDDYAFFPSAVRRRIPGRGNTEDRATGAYLLSQVPGLLLPAADLPPPPKVDSKADKTELTTYEEPSERTNIDHDEKPSTVQPVEQKLDDRELKTPFSNTLKLYRDKVDHEEDDALFGSNDGALDPIAFSTLPPGATGRRRRRDHKKHSEKLAKAVRKQEQLVREAVNAQQGKQADLFRESGSSAPDASLAEQKSETHQDLGEEAKERETDDFDKKDHGPNPVFRSTLAYRAAKAAAAGNEDDKDEVPYLLLPRQSERIAAAEVTTATGDPAEGLSAAQTAYDPLASEKKTAEQHLLHRQAGPTVGPGPAAFVPDVIYRSPEEEFTLSTEPVPLDPSLQDISADLIPAVDEPAGAVAEEPVKEPETPSEEREPQLTAEAAEAAETAGTVAEPDSQIPEYEEPVSPATALANSRLASTLSQQMEAAEQAPTGHKLRGLEIPKSVQGKQNDEGIKSSEDQETVEEVGGATDKDLEESALATKVEYRSHTFARPRGAETQAANKLPKKSAAYTIFSLSQAALSGPLLVAGWLLLSCW